MVERMRAGIVIILCLTAGLTTPSPSFAATRPSILLLTIDTIRGDALPILGNTRDTAPFLDQLARKSTRFTNAHSTSSWTVPAITSLLTGVYPKTHGIVHGAVSRGNVYDQEIISGTLPVLAEELQKLGYKTYGVTANAHLGPDLGYGRGFDRYLCIGVEPAEKVNEALLRWKEAIEAEPGPVFVWVHYYDPHHPYVQHMPWFKEFAGTVTSADSRLMLMAGKSPPVPPRKPADRERFIHLARSLYDSEIRYMDDYIAKLYQDFPQFDQFLTIVAGDHGEEFLEHGDVMHCRNLHRETVRVPIFMSQWTAAAGDVAVSAGVCAAAVSLLDIPATIIEAAGGTIPKTWAGRSLIATAKAPSTTADRLILASLERNRETGVQTTLIGPGWKLIRTPKGLELYDTNVDPGETKDLAPDEASRAAELARKLDEFLESLPAPPAVVERRALSKEAEVQLKGQGYIH